jgi:hypothetical protein
VGVGESDDAQAVQLVRALRGAIDEMTHRLAWLEIRDDSWAEAIRLEAAALRRDIYEAQRHIDRLERHYFLNRDGHTPADGPQRGQAR